jgi:predicted Rdx family selenoprotein
MKESISITGRRGTLKKTCGQYLTWWERKRDLVKNSAEKIKKTYRNIVDGPDVIRTHDLPVISRAHHRAMLRAQKFA